MLETALVAARDRARLIEIAGILISFGIDEIVAQLGLHRLLPKDYQRPARFHQEQSLPERLRQAIEALGPTYIKLGQILATRHDLVGPEWTIELEKLQTRVGAVSWEMIKDQLQEDLGGDPHQLFAFFDQTPIAAASIAQVYRARLHTGEEVVLKVRRPDIEPRIHADLRLLRHVAQLLAASSPEWARFKPEAMVNYLSNALRDELDFVREAQHATTMADHFIDYDEVVFPRIYWQWTQQRLLVQEFMAGQPLLPVAPLIAQGVDVALLAQRGVLAVLKMILKDGFFHADPHPGNMLAMPGNRIGFIDFGMVGRISDKRKMQLLVLFKALAEGRGDGVTAMLLTWADDYNVDPVQLDSSVQGFLAQHSTGRLHISRALMDFMGLARQHHITLPADLSLLFKAFITAEGVLERVDVDLDVLALAQPIISQELALRYSPRALKQRATHLAADMYDLSDDIPNALRLILHRLRHGRVGVDMELRHLNRVVQALERATIRLCVALVTASFVLGLAPRLFDVGPVWFGLSLMGWLGIVATLSGCALLLYWFIRAR